MARLRGDPASSGDGGNAGTTRESANRWRLALVAIAATQAYGICAAAPDVIEERLALTLPSGLARLSIEELADIEVSSVSKRPERLADAAASVYVITRDDIRRSGASTIPEALRLAPNLQVARASSNGYAISARGFNNESSNKLLVMIDGRIVYTPLHSGVFWDVQDVGIADIERIEVVSGPGGTLWGSNAVNGVINVLTTSAMNSIGTAGALLAGSDERGATLRHGVSFGDDGAVRGYVRSQRFDHTERADGTANRDAWDRQQAGFRADWGHLASNWTVQGDAYEGDAQVSNSPDSKVSGANLLARWSREFNEKSGMQVQAYFDTYSRRQPGLFTEDLDTFDVEAMHHFPLATSHEIVWGGGLRQHRDRTTGGALLAFVPADSKLTFANLFVQDTWSLDPRIKLTTGLKAERNTYSGVEYQPNVRIAWKPNEQTLWWGAVSRALRTPSRLDRDLFIFVNLAPPYSGKLFGGPGFMSERLTAYEIGYRSQPRSDVSYSVTAFVNDYDRLRSIEPNGSGGFVVGNGVKARTQGIEFWGSYQANTDWRLSAGLTLLHEDASFAAGSQDPGAVNIGGNDPSHQFSLRSSWELPRGMSFDVSLRVIGALPNPAVPAYTAVDARLGWPITKQLALSFVGLNLLGGRHAEFGSPVTRAEFDRSLSVRLIWTL